MLLQSALEQNVDQCWSGSVVTADNAAHLCAVSMEYELFSASKLPVSYKASIMKRINEVKMLTGQRQLHVALIPCTTDKYTDVTAAGQTLVASVEYQSPLKDVLSPSVDSTAEDDAMRMVPDTHCDNDNITLSFNAHKLDLPKESDNCDVIVSDTAQELRCDVQSSFLSQTVACDKSANCDCQIHDLHDTYMTQNCVNPSHDVDHSSVISVKLESSATDAVVGGISNKSPKKKSVRISNSPPAIRYTNWSHKEVLNGTSSSTVKVS